MKQINKDYDKKYDDAKKEHRNSKRKKYSLTYNSTMSKLSKEEKKIKNREYYLTAKEKRKKPINPIQSRIDCLIENDTIINNLINQINISRSDIELSIIQDQIKHRENQIAEHFKMC